MDIDLFRYTPRYADIDTWMFLSGMSRSATNAAIERGTIRTIKVGNRRLIDVRRGLEWLGSLPDALPPSGRPRSEAPSTAA